MQYFSVWQHCSPYNTYGNKHLKSYFVCIQTKFIIVDRVYNMKVLQTKIYEAFSYYINGLSYILINIWPRLYGAFVYASPRNNERNVGK